MAEFLVYNKKHWMDIDNSYINAHSTIDNDPTLSLEQKIKNKSILTNKYNSRYQKGDIIEVRPDGFWTDGKRKGFGNHAFALVVVPGVSFNEAKKYMDPQETIENKGLENEIRTTTKRRKYQVDLKQVVLDAEKKVEVLNITNAHIISKV